jgi:hypothetical protein
VGLVTAPDIIAILAARGHAQTILVEPYLGAGGDGPRYGPAVTVDCFYDEARKKVRDALGAEVISEATAYTRLNETIPVESRITFGDRVSYVIAVKRRDGAGLPVPSHLEVVLT